MNPIVFELGVNADGVAETGKGVLAVFIPAGDASPALVVAGCDPRHDPGKPIEGLAGSAFFHIFHALGKPEGLRWVVVDALGRFFQAEPKWDESNSTLLPLLEFKRFPDGVGIDAFTKAVGDAGEAALELLATVVEGKIPEALPGTARQFIEAIELHGNLPSPGALFHVVQTASVTGDITAATKAIQADPVISATLINFANAAAFAGAGKTASVAAAVQRLGINQVRRVVFVAEMMAHYQKGACAEFDYKTYWHNAVATGAAMRGLIESFEIPARYGDDAFTTGLVSGLGWLAIAETFPTLLGDYIKLATGLDPVAKAKLQREIFPASIPEVTAAYLGRFEFPEMTRAAIMGVSTSDGWAWFDCLAQAMRVAQSMAPLSLLALPENIPVPDRCREEWENWSSLLKLSS